MTRSSSCVQGMDMYSNILYVKEQFAALSHLAHRVATADKFRPETCCIIGNYYSLKGQHEKVLLPAAPAKRLGSPKQLRTHERPACGVFCGQHNGVH